MSIILKRKAQKPERQMQDTILQYLAVVGIFAWRQNTGAVKVEDRLIRFGAVGCPDIIGILPSGKMLAIEVKSPKGRLSHAQKNFLDAIASNNGTAIVARKLEDVQRAISEQKIKK